jgi:two-component system NtrC family response regulator
LAYRWPGNVRELENVVERLVVLADSPDVGVADLPEFLQPEPSPVEAINLDLPPSGISLGGIEKDVLLRTLQQFDWNQSKAARYLGLTRKTLAYRAQKYELLTKLGGMVRADANASEPVL